MTKNEEWWKMERTSTVAKGRANSGGGSGGRPECQLCAGSLKCQSRRCQ